MTFENELCIADKEHSAVGFDCSAVVAESSVAGTDPSAMQSESSTLNLQLSSAGMEDSAGNEGGTCGGGGVPSDDVFPGVGSPEAVPLLGVAWECVGEPLLEEALECVGEQYLARMCRNGSADFRLNTVTWNVKKYSTSFI